MSIDCYLEEPGQVGGDDGDTPQPWDEVTRHEGGEFVGGGIKINVEKN